MNTPRPSLPEAGGAVEPGFADVPLFAINDNAGNEAIESGPRALLEGPTSHEDAAASEQLPPGRSTRPGEH